MSIKESIKKIINKKFDTVINGYSPSNVDSFLDLIIRDLELLEADNEKINNKNAELESEISKLKKEIIKLKDQLEHQRNDEIDEEHKDNN